MEKVNNMKWWQKLSYGLGDFGGNITYSLVTSFVLIYCTNVLGLSAGVIGTIILISKMLDGLSDLIMGMIIDRTRSKMGKARFWVIVSALPVAIATFALFNIPSSFSESTKYIWFFIFYVLLSAVFYTMSNIAYASMIALITKDPQEQVSLYSFRMIFAMVGVLVFSFATNAGVEAFGGGQSGWFAMSLIFSVIGFITLLLPAVNKELPQAAFMDNRKGEDSKLSYRVGFGESVKLLLTHKYFIIIFLIYVFNYMISGLSSGGAVYFAAYILENPNMMGFLSMTMTVPIIIFLPFVSKLVAKMSSMQQSLIIGGFISIAGSVVILIGGWMGVTVLMIGLIVRTIGTLPGSATFGPLTAAADENLYLCSGRRVTGMFFSCTFVGIKIGSGLGSALYGIFLDMGGV